MRRADPNPEIFGASHHQWQLNAPASEDEIAGFERNHGVELPREYRRFLREVGNGGAGPYYGVLPLGEPSADDAMGELRLPFPHVSAWNDPPASNSQDDDDRYFDAALVNGAIPIAHQGCGYIDLLVIAARRLENQSESARSAKRAFLASGFTGCADGPADLAANYKL